MFGLACSRKNCPSSVPPRDGSWPLDIRGRGKQNLVERLIDESASTKG